MTTDRAVIAGYARSPFTLAGRGALARTRPDDLAAETVAALVARTGVKPEDIEALILGCAFPEGEQGLNVARLVVLNAGLPQSVGGYTVNHFCGSSMQAVQIAAGHIAAGAGDVFIAAGVESMSRVPMMGFNPLPNPALHAKLPAAFIGMGETAENVAERWQIPRAEQEAFALRSQARTAAAIADGRLKDEIVAINTKAGAVDTDGCPRPATDAAALAGLKPAFSAEGTVTAGTSSPLTDGAAAVLVCSEAYARQHGLDILARVVTSATAGCAPEIMGVGPIGAARKALARAGLGVADLDVIELNEAFASQSLAYIRDLGLDPDKVNIDGGAIALGHPLGATGARITGKAASLLKRTGGRYALATQCIGGGQGIATILERGVMASITKAAVIGAGTMGAAIAAQFANAGIPVLLLDIVPPGANRRSALAEGAIAKMQKTDPAPFMSKRAVELVTPGNVEDDLGQIAGCDWVVEAIIERLDLKQALYRKLDAVRRPGTAISSNTSTIPLAKLTEGLPEAFRRDFLITHFFNPPRYMRLLEVVTGPDTDPDLAATAGFADIGLGKSVVRANDTPGFIANRLGVFWLQTGVIEALDAGLTVEQADAVMGKPFGIPRTGVFGLIDLVGLDLMPHINASLASGLPASDPFHGANRDVPLIGKMIADGYTGRKGKGGFYRRGAKGREAIDLETGQYGPLQTPVLPELASRDLRALLAGPSEAARYGWRVLGQTLAYAAALVPEAAATIDAIDEAMRLGYNWRWGPFELIDKLGAGWLAERLATDGMPVPPLLAAARGKSFYRLNGAAQEFLGTDGAYHGLTRPAGVLWLADIKRAAKPLLKNPSAAVWDIGDGVLCFEYTSKSNSLDQQNLDLLSKTIDLLPQAHKALVIYNEGENFSAGAKSRLGLFAANIAAWGEIEKLVSAGQQVYKKLKYAGFPTVAAPFGMALGGGCEILLHSTAVQAHAEAYIGLVECGVGLVPAWGGCTEMLARWAANKAMSQGPMPAATKVFETVSVATVSKSAAEARDHLFLRDQDGITMNRYRLLADAKAKALALVENYVPPTPPVYQLPGASGRVAFSMAAEDFRKKGIATSYDMVVADELAGVLSGGAADLIDRPTEQDVLGLERAAFMRLIKQDRTLARIETMLTTGKPLRN